MKFSCKLPHPLESLAMDKTKEADAHTNGRSLIEKRLKNY
jgi:hypothetical protein